MAAGAIVVVEFSARGLLRVEAEFGVGFAPLDIAASKGEERENHHGGTEAPRNRSQDIHDYCRRGRIIRKAWP